MNKEDKKLQEHLVNEMMKVNETNPDVMIYMQSLMKCYEELEQENQQLKKQKDDAIEYIKKNILIGYDKYGFDKNIVAGIVVNDLLRMLGEIDE